MIHYIKGIITETKPGIVVIENNNIGFEIHVPDNSSAFLASENELVTLYTEMLVREDDISLYGFTDKQSLEMFDTLMTVNGIGAKAALSVLSAFGIEELRKAIAFEDVALITKANGIGKKTAQRIVLELKDKIDISRSEDFDASVRNTIESGSAKDEAVAALISLGFTKTEAMSALLGINEEGLSPEEYIKRALKSRR